MEIFSIIIKTINSTISDTHITYAYKICEHVGNALQAYQDYDMSDSIRRSILIGSTIYAIDMEKYRDNLEKIIEVIPDIDQDLIYEIIALHKCQPLSQHCDFSQCCEKYKYILRDCLILAAALDQFPPNLSINYKDKYLDKTFRVYTQEELDIYIRNYNNEHGDISYIDDCYVRLFHCNKSNIISQNKYIMDQLSENYKKLSVLVLNFWNNTKCSTPKQIDIDDNLVVFYTNKNAMRNSHLDHFYHYFLDFKNFDKMEFRMKNLEVEDGNILYHNFNLQMLYLQSGEVSWCIRADELYRIVSLNEVDNVYPEYFWGLKRDSLVDQQFIEYVLRCSVITGKNSKDC